ncbi:unnamed protein product [Hydatigera taeniaeformis]|uniref:Tetraspanin n=1 Tax=Hydatigena taeniaeformis TaxID=6205 RepID=A0A0R3XCC1_HYDTA|nr:unnamed protein product [Hydatigera taeniaeformis]
MSKNVKRGFRIALQILALILTLAYFSTAITGVVLRVSKGWLETALSNDFDGYVGDEENLRQFAIFVLELADRMSIYGIATGFILALLCLVGLIGSWYNWRKMLNIYSGILVVFLIAQIVIANVAFPSPITFSKRMYNSTEELLKFYGDKGEKGEKATGVWNVLMETYPQCCGMEGYKDFGKLKGHTWLQCVKVCAIKPLPPLAEDLGKALPPACCNMTSGVCHDFIAKNVGLMGCKSKIELIGILRSEAVLSVTVAIIMAQLLLTLLVLAFSCTTEKEEEKESRSKLLTDTQNSILTPQ